MVFAQEAQLLVSKKNAQLQAKLDEPKASNQPHSPYGDDGGQVDLTDEAAEEHPGVAVGAHPGRPASPLPPSCRSNQGLHDGS